MLWLAGTMVAGIFLLLTPFVTQESVLAWVRHPAVRLALTVVSYAVCIGIGYALGRRRRTYSGPLIVLPPGTSAPKVVAEEPSTWERLHEDERTVLTILFRAPEHFVPTYNLQHQTGWDTPRWNATVFALEKEQRLVRQSPIDRYERQPEGLVLTELGQRVTKDAFRANRLSKTP